MRTGPLAGLRACSLAPLIHLLIPHCSLLTALARYAALTHLFARSLIHSRARERKVFVYERVDFIPFPPIVPQRHHSVIIIITITTITVVTTTWTRRRQFAWLRCSASREDGWDSMLPMPPKPSRHSSMPCLSWDGTEVS